MIAVERRAQGWIIFSLTRKENYKFGLGFQPTLEELARADIKNMH